MAHDRLIEAIKRGLEKIGDVSTDLANKTLTETIGEEGLNKLAQEIYKDANIPIEDPGGTPARVQGGTPAPQESQETFAGDNSYNRGRTARPTGEPPAPAESFAAVSAKEKRTSPYTVSTSLKDPDGVFLTNEGVANLADDDAIERYTVFFGEVPKDIATARAGLLDLLKNTNKKPNPLFTG